MSDRVTDLFGTEHTDSTGGVGGVVTEHWLAEHLPGPTNPRVNLHQEYAMRTGGYDDVARLVVVDVPGLADVGRLHPAGGYWDVAVRHVVFADVVAAVGVDAAIRAVWSCAWLSLSDCIPDPPDPPDPPERQPRPCVECVEVAHA